MRTEWWKPVIFDFHTDETAGERFRCRILELPVAGRACWFALSLGLYVPRIEAAVLPLGIARCDDLSFWSDNGLSLRNAAAITSLCAVAMHLGVTAVMGIRFDASVLILLPLWNPVPAPLERVRSAGFDRGRPRAEPQSQPPCEYCW